MFKAVQYILANMNSPCLEHRAGGDPVPGFRRAMEKGPRLPAGGAVGRDTRGHGPVTPDPLA